MLDALRPYRRPRPTWPGRLVSRAFAAIGADPAGKFPVDRALDNSLVYPGSGTDWSPIRQTLGIVHSYVYFDFNPEIWDQIDASMREGLLLADGRSIARPCSIVRFDARDILSDAPDCEQLLAERGQIEQGYRAAWGIYRLHGVLFSVLAIEAEAIEGIARLYLSRGKSPRGLALVEHGFAGNPWGCFGRPYERLIAGCGLAWPEILIVAPSRDEHGFARRAPYAQLCEDIAVESALRDDNRQILALDGVGLRPPFD